MPSSELENAIWYIINEDSIPPENVIQLIKLYIANDRIIQSQLLIEKIILFYLKHDRIDVWNLNGTQYISSAQQLKEVNQDFLEYFHLSFKPKVKNLMAEKKLKKELHAQINF